MGQNRQLIPAILLSAVVVVVAVLGSFVYAETASVKVSVPPQKLVATTKLSSGQGSGDLRTQHIDATVTEAESGTASTVFVAATFASGSVVFTCSTSSCPAQFTVAAGTLVTTSKSLGYATQAAGVVTRTNPATVGVRATATGASWNTAPGTVTVIPQSQYSSDLHVTNPAAIAGGADATSKPVIQQSDFDSVRTTLTAQVNDALGVALKAKAYQMSFIADGPPVLTVISDHKVGDAVPAFTITITGTLGATAFADDEAKALMRTALDAKVPAGQQLTNDPIQYTWQIQRTPNAGLTVNGTAVGYISPTISTNALRSRIRGLNVTDARKSIEHSVPGSQVEIHISPVAVPWLPLVAEHIMITVQVQSLAH